MGRRKMRKFSILFFLVLRLSQSTKEYDELLSLVQELKEVMAFSKMATVPGFPISPAEQAVLDSNEKTLNLIDQVENTPSLQNAQKLVASLPKPDSNADPWR